MARTKATTTDIHARLARAECANFRTSGCRGNLPCTIINGEPCAYFSDYVQPLLSFPDIAAKYGREAKIAVALNPNAKVIRKRRQAAEPRLLDAAPPKAPAPAAATPKTRTPAPMKAPDPVRPTPVVLPAPVVVTPPPAPVIAARPVSRPAPAPQPEQPMFMLELSPSAPTTKKRRR
jgi:hypothetical protein